MTAFAKTARRAIAALVTAVGLSGGAAQAQDSIELKVATFLPTTHFQQQQGTMPFMETLTELTDGRVKFSYFPAEQGGKAGQMFDLLKAGVFDIVEFGSGYVGIEQLPLLSILEVPGMVSSSCQGGAALRELASPGGVIYESGFKPAGMRPISYFIYPPYGIMSRVSITSLDDLKGKKMRTAGAINELSAIKSGGVSVKATAGELYEALSRGTVDATMYSFLATKGFGYEEVAPYGVTGYSFGTPGSIMVMNERSYQNLPPEIQEAVLEAGRMATENFCTYTDANEAARIEELKAGGMTFYTWTDEQKAALDAIFQGVGQEWAANQDKRGIPATQALEDFAKTLASD
ncbi:TRAP transporter substrate-binding protein DctP [Salipiger sp. P9]|uniref:TRAP transporter substrate-binding protein n=1 Tax=Salipiger pentaromativorans TaxID=2943193 RepID=UPI00215773CA|nr:TRAP transporter substrate-binding protein DctP [Salipiger pentaromativorans]MCR8549256.1 TRAP transporter substrate-binding protein DctP [Salipiger pentaromativorans]